MKNWKRKYMALFLVAVLGGAMMAFTACDGAGSKQSSVGESMETSSSLIKSSLDESASEETEQSAASSEEIEQSKENAESVEGELSSKEENGGEKEPDGGNEEKPEASESVEKPEENVSSEKPEESISSEKPEENVSSEKPEVTESTDAPEEKPEEKPEEQPTVLTEEEWEKALTATNYTALGEMWTTNSTSPVLNVKREENSYYMGTTSEEYIVQVGEPNVYFRWDRSEKAWKEDDSAPSQQHLIPEQMRAVLHGAYNLFDYNEEKGYYQASEITLTVSGQAMLFDTVTVSFENGNLSVLYCDAITSGLRFTYSQYGATRVEFFEKTDTEEGPSINDTDNMNNGNGATTDKMEEGFSK